MAWGAAGARGADDLIAKLRRNDPKLASLHILRFRKFGHQEAVDLCEAAANNTILEELYCSGHRLEPRTVEAFRELLTHNTTLRSLCIGDDTLGDAGLECLCGGLSANTGLRVLDLENKGVSAAGCAALASALRSCVVQDLRLSRNGIGGAGAAHLARGVSHITHLDLRHAQLCGEGLAELCRGFQRVQVLQLSNNACMGPGCGPALAAVLAHEPSQLRELHLHECGISDQDVKDMSGALTSAGSLQLLDLTRNSITGEGALSLGAALRSRSGALQTLKLSDNELLGCGISALCGPPPSVALAANLELGGCGIDAQGIASLANCSGLKHLELLNSSMDEAAVDALLGLMAVPGSVLEHVGASGCGLDMTLLERVLKGVARVGAAPALTTLELGCNPGIEHADFEPLVESVRSERPSLDVAWKASDHQTGAPSE